MRPSPIPNSTKHTLLLSIIHGIGKQVKNQYWTFNFGLGIFSQFKRRLPASPVQRLPKILLCNPDILRHAKPLLI